MRGEGLYCRSVALDGLFEFVRKKGGDPIAFAATVGLNPDFKSKPVDFVPWNTICDYLELCAAQLNAPAFGVEWAMSLPKDSRNSGPLLVLGAIKRNLKETIDLAAAYQKIHTNGVAYSYIEYPEKSEFQGFFNIHPLSRQSRQFCEHIMAHTVLLTQNYLPQLKYKRMYVQHSAPQDPTIHDIIFPFPKTYNADRNSLVIDDAIFDVPPSRIVSFVLPLMQSYLNRRHKSLSAKSSITMDVVSLLPNMFGLRVSRIGNVANAMGVSEKKLQRLLREEGTTFSAVLDDVRRTTATRLLLESNISIIRLARMLDYSGIESFNMACQRWHGLSPRQFRNKERMMRLKAEPD